MKNQFFKLVFSAAFALIMLQPVAVLASADAPAANFIDAKEIISDIITTVGLKQNFSIMESAAIPNAAAIIYKGKRVIAYNPRFVTDLNTVAGNKWAAVSVLAHEIGHHLNGHTLLSSGSEPPLELEADEFSGFVLRKMGASLSQSQAAMKIAANYKQSHTHPAQQDRLVAIAKGWSNAVNVPADLAKYNQPEVVNNTAAVAAANRNLQRSMQPATSTASTVTGVIDSRNIIAKIDFPSDRSASYYVTSRFNLVKVLNNETYLLGKMLPTTSREFPYVLRNGASNDLFVHQSGRILTSQKQLAGYIKMRG
ncbi:MAG: membrane-binding protein [Chitinophagaceae bacterium]|nr:MAG: membrane-binding protein [Chitinophagaceae bacterium]